MFRSSEQESECGRRLRVTCYRPVHVRPLRVFFVHPFGYFYVYLGKIKEKLDKWLTVMIMYLRYKNIFCNSFYFFTFYL